MYESYSSLSMLSVDITAILKDKMSLMAKFSIYLNNRPISLENEGILYKKVQTNLGKVLI